MNRPYHVFYATENRYIAATLHFVLPSYKCYANASQHQLSTLKHRLATLADELQVQQFELQPVAVLVQTLRELGGFHP